MKKNEWYNITYILRDGVKEKLYSQEFSKLMFKLSKDMKTHMEAELAPNLTEGQLHVLARARGADEAFGFHSIFGDDTSRDHNAFGSNGEKRIDSPGAGCEGSTDRLDYRYGKRHNGM
jgi:hypothetical protein